MDSYRYVILGGGVVAGYAAQAFAEEGVEPQQLALISEDHILPYERPPLSKDYLAGEKEQDELLINEPEFYQRNGIVTHLNTRIDKLDLTNKNLISSRGERIGFDKLLIATGSRLRKLDLPGADDKDIHYLRWLDDAKKIRQHAEQAQSAVVIGGGFIGMETAAVLASYDIDVSWVFSDKYPMDGFFTPEMADFFMGKYNENGVTLVPQRQVQSFRRESGRLAVVLDNGKTISVDMAIAGIGVEPAVEIFESTDLHIDNGIVVNEYLEANLPDIYAAGDVTNYRDLIFDKQRHIEHWDNAKAQGQHVATIMMGRHEPFNHLPYFFSDEFDLSWEYWGDMDGAQQIVHRGDVQGGAFSTWWLKDGHLVAAFIMDRPDEERQKAQEWIRARRQVSAEVLADESVPLDQ